MPGAGREQAFNEVGGEFLRYYDTVRGHVREQITRANLELHLPKSKDIAIIDVGGGDARDAVWLKGLGYSDITVVDPSSAMLGAAAERLSTIQGTEKDALNHFGEESFDLLLSHGVLMYQTQDIEGHFSNLARLIKPGGRLSLLTRGFQATLERLTKDGDINGINRLTNTRMYTNNLGEQTIPLRPREISKLFESNGLTILGWYGVRISTDEDFRPLQQVSTPELDGIIHTERESSNYPGQKDRGQMLHFVGVKA